MKRVRHLERLPAPKHALDRPLRRQVRAPTGRRLVAPDAFRHVRVLEPSGAPLNTPFDREAGLTLVEVLVAVVILSISVVAILGAMTTLASTSTLDREQADVAAVARAAVEAVKGDTYISCAAPSGQYSVSSVSVEQDTQAPTVVEVTGLGGSPVYWTAGGGWQACSSDPGVQLVEVSDTSKDGKVLTSLYVVKSTVSD